jgi:serine/threonine protein kinase
MSIQLAIRSGQLTLLGQVGSGATSHVWRGTYTSVDNAIVDLPVAVKIGRTPADRSLLATEAERLLWSQSFGTAQLVDAGRIRHSSNTSLIATDSVCLALSWVGAVSLENMPLEDSEPAFERTLHLARDIGDALGDLHQAGFAHGDVKPANIVAKEGTGNDQPGRFVLVDLGLSDAADNPTPRGATLRYLAPETLGGSAKGDGRTRDLWALGVVLADAARGKISSRGTISAALADDLPEPLGTLIRACLAASPGARPSARWLSRRAAAALPFPLAEGQARQRRLDRLRRAYLQVRRAAILSAARYSRLEFEVAGPAQLWMQSAVSQLRGLFDLRGESLLEGTARLAQSSPLDRQRILTNLVGPTAANWPVAIGESEEQWLSHWLSLCDSSDELGWTLSSGVAARSSSIALAPATLTEVALDLGAGRYDPHLLETAEQLAATGQVPSVFRIVLAKRLRATGEWARAKEVLAQASDPLSRAEAAETARRSGERALAQETSAALLGHSDPAVSARARATYARVLLDEGRLAEAEASITNAPISAAVCEAHALVQLALGQREAARETIHRGRALPAGDEEHARLEGLIGMLEHADGDAESSARAFRQAVELSSRSGAVLEEATYLTGLSNACVNSGALGEAIAASERAIALFEALNRPTEAARAALNLVVAHAETGRLNETRSAFDFAISLTRQAQDQRCLGYLHLALVDALPTASDEATDLLSRAAHWLNPLGTDAEIWVAARRCEHRLELPIEHYDRLVRKSDVSIESRLLWWSARARRSVWEHNSAEGPMILGELTPLAAMRSPIFTQGRALAAGVELATFVGAGDITRRLTQTVAELTRRIFVNCPKELHPALDALPWVCAGRSAHSLPLSPEQIVDLEALVRSLGRRDELRGLLEQVVDALVLWTGVERGLLLLRAPGGKLLPRVGRNLARNDLVGDQRDLSHSLALQALALGEPIVAVDATRELESVHASVHALKLRSVLAVPLIAHGEALGVVYLDDRVRQGAFGERELAWVRLVATIAAVAIADARDRLTLRRLARRAERAEMRVSSALARREAELGQVRVQ